MTATTHQLTATRPAPRLSLAQRFRLRRARTAWVRAQLAVCEPVSRLDVWDRRSA